MSGKAGQEISKNGHMAEETRAGVDREVGRLGKPRHLVLGMDPGIKSCGFALIDTANHEILEMGVRLFDSPEHPKTKQSLAAIRRGFRSARRNIDRTQDRLKHCLDVLKKHDVVPQDATKEYFHTVKGDRPPLRLRVYGLDHLLTAREWALVLYSLCKRRGYIPHGEGTQDKSSEGGKVLAALSANQKSFEESGFRTIGEWLDSCDRSRNRGGSYEKCVTHAQLVDETHMLFAAQRSLGSEFASEELEREYLEQCDWERSRVDFDRKSYDLVGACTYFPDEKRAARCTLTSELVAAYAALGNVTIVQNNTTTRRLSAAERDACIGILFSTRPLKGNKSCAVKFGALRRQLDLYSSESFKGVPLAEEKNREVYKPQGWRALRSVLCGKNPELLEHLRQDLDLADEVMEAAAYASSIEVLRNRLGELGLSVCEIDDLCALPYSSKALNGYGSRSKKALSMLLDCLREPGILTLTDAEEACGLDAMRAAGSRVVRTERLMPYECWLKETGGTNNNPVVIRALSQMRKVVNAICRKWGVPNEIHVELDRELRLPKRAQEQIARANKRNERERQRISGQISELLTCSPEEVSRKQIEKYRMWEEQAERDLYTGDAIEAMRLLQDETYAQVDHVLPFSRTGDNSKHNKVLVLSASNQLKRERMPYEWMTSGETDVPSWPQFKRRVEENSKLSFRKKCFLLEDDLESKESDFLQRNMADTAYMSREVCAYLSDCLLFPDDGMKVHVVPISSRATAWLRRSWGLNFGLAGEKDRSDDRHHATDACVIAACNRSLVVKTAKISKKTHRSVTYGMTEDERRQARVEALRDAMPWDTFADDVRRSREDELPTRFVPRKGSGELFEQTIYSYVGRNDKGQDLGRKNDSGKEKVMGNAIVSEDGKSVIKVSEMLCLRLWHDPEIKKRGKVVGGWYADPVYKSDVPALKDGSYVPKATWAGHGRSIWTPIPERVLAGKPIEIYLGDLVSIGDAVGRFAGINIANGGWKFTDPLTREIITFPTIASLTSNSLIEVSRSGLLSND